MAVAHDASSGGGLAALLFPLRFLLSHRLECGFLAVREFT